MQVSNDSDKKNLTGWIVVFGFCAVHWIYLIFASQMSINADAEGYYRLAKIIYHQGWVAFFEGGPQREPLYPALISVSLALQDLTGFSFEIFQRIVQFLILFGTQILMIRIMGRLDVPRRVQYGIVVYAGFSPALVNGAVSLFSEIVSYPVALAAILLNVSAWRSAFRGETSRCTLWGALTALCFLLGNYSRGVFQYVMYVFLLFYLVLAISQFLKKNFAVTKAASVFILTAFVVFQAFFLPYKFLNQKYNGHFDYTNRFHFLLFGNAMKRARPLRFNGVLTHLASIPGGGFCRMFFTNEECKETEFEEVDGIVYWFKVRNLAQAGLSQQEARPLMLHIAAEQMVSNPGKTLFFAFIEGSRMFFWESTKIGFVFYPDWLEEVFDSPSARYGLRSIAALMTVCAFGYVLFFLFRRRQNIYNFNPNDSLQEKTVIVFFCVLIIVSYVGLYSLFSVVTRYALPIAPIFLIFISVMLKDLPINREGK